jgi:Ca-activated chloride channel family protein
MRHRWLRVWVALALVAGACGVGSQGTRTPRGLDSSGRARSAEDLASLALAGTSEASEDHLTARRALRPVRVPRVGRGANARFEFDHGKRGWVTAMPSEELLVSPAFANGKIFVGGGFASHQFYALDAYDGELRWAVAAPDGGPTAAIVHKARVIFNTESCTLFVVDAETGELRWKRWLGDPLMSQPAATDEMVLSAYPANGAHVFGAFRLSDGEPIWTTPIPADVIQAPQVASGSVWFATMDGSAFRLNLRDGRVRWHARTGAASPLFVDGDRVLTTRRVDEGDSTFEQPVVLSAINGEIVREAERIPAPYLRGGTRERELFHAQAGAWGNVPHGQHLGLTNVAAGWAFQGSSAAVLDGRAYFAVAGEIRAREIATGRDVWRRTYAEAASSQAVSPPAVVGAQMSFGTLDGHLYATDIDTGMTLWAYDVGEPIVFQPIVAQGWVYVATARGNVVGLEIGDPGLDGWHMWGGNAEHTGLVETAGELDPALVASRERPSRGTMRLAAFTPRENEAPEEPEQASDADGVLRIERREQPELPLTATRVDGTISGFVARMVVTQVFENPYDRPIEAVYLFPLPDGAAVDAMEMRIGERVVRGRIQERRQARATYEAARTEGRRAALLEASRPALFTQRVANIQPGERIEVRIAYAQHLPYEDGSYEVTFPMSAPRRFDPSPSGSRTRDELATRDTVAAASARTSERAPAEIRLDLDAALPIATIASPSHRVSIDRDGSRARVVLARGDGAVDRDFVLRYGVGGEAPRAAVIAHREEEGGYVTLVIEPPVVENAEAAPRDVVFVVDTSSSMRGRPMEQAKAAMRASLRGLRGSDTFQILAFSDGLERSSPSPVVASESSIAEGMTFIDRIRAVGATRMVPAIESALDEAMSPEAGRVRLVVLVTDGYVANEREVLSSIASKLDGERIYALGVGGSPNRFLLDRATEIGRGRAMYVGLSEEPAASAAKFVALVDKPVLTDIAVDWDGLEVSDVYPRFTPDLFAGRPLVLHARYGRGGRANVRVSGTFAGERHEQTIAVALPDRPNGTANDSQRVLWARAAVADRLNRMSLREDEALVREVTELGLRHAIVTPYTSFVAVDVEETPSQPNAQEAAPTPTLSPARSLPGDPEIRIPAPRDARAVTIILPFGETLSAAWEPELRTWSARFLVPRDAEEGTYPIYVLVTHADGREERSMLWYTVDQAAPVVRVTASGDVRPGSTITLTATQVLTSADLAQVNESRSTLTDARADPDGRTPRGGRDAVGRGRAARGVGSGHVER